MYHILFLIVLYLNLYVNHTYIAMRNCDDLCTIVNEHWIETRRTINNKLQNIGHFLAWESHLLPDNMRNDFHICERICFFFLNSANEINQSFEEKKNLWKSISSFRVSSNAVEWTQFQLTYHKLQVNVSLPAKNLFWHHLFLESGTVHDSMRNYTLWMMTLCIQVYRAQLKSQDYAHLISKTFNIEQKQNGK